MQFVVGTGGKNHVGFSTIQPNSVVRNSLITCGGAFDPVAREYRGRLIVRAVREG